ncbi:hypothetical protein ACWC9H_27205 [Streptomyces sp. NPDC001251]
MSTNQTPGPDSGPGLTDSQAAILEGLRAEGLTGSQIIDRICRANRVHHIAEEETSPLVRNPSDVEASAPAAPAVRILTGDEYRAAFDALRGATHRHGSRLGITAAHEALVETLAALRVFTPPLDPDPDSCTALYLPTDPDEYDADTLGYWQQCADEPGHDGDDHDSGDASWTDNDPHTRPAAPGA